MTPPVPTTPPDRVLRRLAEGYLGQVLRTMPVAVVMGARQTGKSTLVQTMPELQGRPYVSLDNAVQLADAREDPAALVRRAPRLTIDEIQRVPTAVLAVKEAVDERRPRDPGRFVLTGSANLLLMQQVKESLAGRAGYATLWPMTRREQMGLGRAGIWSELFATPAKDWYELVRSQAVPGEDWRELALRGGYPTPATELATAEQRAIWFTSYIATYLERDVAALASIDHLGGYNRLLRALALRVGNLLNVTDVARDVALPRTTTDRYLDLLEISYQLIRLQSFSTNHTTRIVKAPKVYWSDTGLALYLAGLAEPTGAHLENLVLLDLVAWRDGQVHRPAVMYWRTATRREVDFVVELNGELIAIEVKAGANPGQADARHLHAFTAEYGDRVRGALLLHGGDETFWMGPKVLAAPWWRLV